MVRRAGIEPAGRCSSNSDVCRCITCAWGEGAGRKSDGAQGGIRTRRPMFLKHGCLPLHHLRVKRSGGGSNARPLPCRFFNGLPLGCRSALYGPCGDRTRIAALKGRCPGRLDEGIAFCPDVRCAGPDGGRFLPCRAGRGKWYAGRDSDPQDPVPETGMILPLHHLRVWRSESGSNAQAHCCAASLAGRCLTN